ncbi:MAG: 2-keto-4-pentenoate hydratase [Oxalobacteraceae bacterium]
MFKAALRAPLLTLILALSGVSLPVALAWAACPEDAAVDAYLSDFAHRRLSKGFGNEITLADAECAKRKLGQKLPKFLGSPIGYKAAFANPVLQQRFGVDGPKWGYMYDRNFVDIIAVLPADFGVRPLVEADFLVEVKDPRLADAKTPLEALGYLESVIPFIELPDLMLEGQFSGNAMIATNVAFRGGVTGMEIPVQKTQAFLDALANMTVVMTDDADNKEIGRVKGTVLMDHPINAAMWLAKELKKDGIRLKKGDLLSLGGFINPVPPKPGMKARVQYIGLPGDPQVTVEFN